MIDVPASLRQFADLFSQPIYLVGGYVRDALCGRKSDDYDICSPLSCEEVLSVIENRGFTVSLIKKDTGTLSIISGEDEWQYTAFRTDVYHGGHTPISTNPTDIFGDAKRRDFKANAVYYDIKKNVICDPLGGVKDIENRVLSTTRAPKEVFSEDGLRLMRLARLSAEIGFSVEEETLEGAYDNAEKITEIAAERIRVELERILQSDRPKQGLKLLLDEGVLDYILPEIVAGYGLPQRTDYHRYDVFYHTLATVEAADKSVRCAALFHDVGKPKCFKETGSFHGHDVVGAELTRDIMRRLRYSNAEISETERLVLYHMLDLKGDMKENKLRLFIQKNVGILKKLCLLKNADMIGCGYVTEGESPSSVRLQKIYSRMREEGVPFTVKQLLIRGDNIPERFLPKEKRGEALNDLLCQCALKGCPLTTKEKQLQYIISKYSKKGR